MSEKGKTSPRGAFLRDLIFIGPFFLLSFLALRGAVPTDHLLWNTFWAAMVGLSMTGVAWLALQMFKVVLADQLEQNRAHEPQK